MYLLLVPCSLQRSSKALQGTILPLSFECFEMCKKHIRNALAFNAELFKDDFILRVISGFVKVPQSRTELR